MSSILTNMSAMSAVAALSATQKSLAQTQGEISTGLKVGSAADNAAYWSIATTMRSDIGALGAVSDSLNLGSSVIGVATAALSQSIDVLNKMKDDVVSATQSGVDASKVQINIKSLQGQLRSFANSATFNGVNLLAGPGTATVVTSFSRNTDGIQGQHQGHHAPQPALHHRHHAGRVRQRHPRRHRHRDRLHRF